jgi:hypothetical protein
MVPLLAGGLCKAVPGGVGICGGVLSAVLPTVAAGMPIIFTLGLNSPLIMPVKGCGSGVGGEPGTITICVSVATI